MKTPILPLALAALLLALASPLAADTVIVSLGGDPDRGAGTDADGNLLLYTPDPVEGGSSVSHWDISASPDLLMEPTISPLLDGGQFDVTVAALRQLGWPGGGGSTVNIDFGDGFDDPTLGADRQAAFQRAADLWAGRVQSDVSIDIEVSFADLDCSETGGAVLAQAGPNCVFDNLPGIPDTWFPQALAEALIGSNAECFGDSTDLRVVFNENIDDACLGAGSSYYYGLDGDAPNTQVSFLNVAIHEIAHGLGFTSLVDKDTGEKFQGKIDIFSDFIRDLDTGRKWRNMTSAQIRRSVTNTRRVIFDSSEVRSAARGLLDEGTFVRIDVPADITRELAFGTAFFGPALKDFEISGELVLVDDGSPSPTEGCGTLNQNLTGKIALVDRGTCLFAEKVKNAQNAGASAVIVANNQSGLINMGGEDPTITIPSVFISQSDGALLKGALADAEMPVEGVGELTDAPTTPCFEDDETLCLAGGRFEVNATFAFVDGTTGTMGVERVTDDTGSLYFLNPSNVEVFVKVLNGCPVNERWWIFIAGLTDQGIQLVVRDTVEGKARTFSRAAGNVFETFTGTVDELGAFDTCP